MALARMHRGDSGMNYWPGFVDALSTLILSIIFLLSVFVIVQFYLQQEVQGKNTALQRLNAQIAELSDLLSMEKAGNAKLEKQLGGVQASLATAQSERDKYKSSYEAAATNAATAQGKVTDLSSQLAGQKEISGQALTQVETLNQQIAALRQQLAALNAALDVSTKKETASQQRISDLGQRLNVALAQHVQELSRYRSDFFGKLREILGNRPDMRIVGDRFVLQSEVFFDTGRGRPQAGGPRRTRRRRQCHRGIGRTNPGRHSMGIAGRWSHRRAADRVQPIQVKLGSVGGARDLRGTIFDCYGRQAGPPGRRRVWRISADRSRRHRGRLSAQSPH
jgi:predicted  nucleic acid-binding Zn-ribbon protein